MINVLIRTSYRPYGFLNTLESIYQQSYKNVRIIVSYDDEKALNYIPDNVDKIRVHKHDALFFYDNYCNKLKSQVTDGWFFFLDDGDVLSHPTILEALRSHLSTKHGTIVQFSRSGRLKPGSDLIKKAIIKRGKIGMPCLVLHHSMKNLVNIDGSVGAADYWWIKNISRKIKLKFVPLCLVHTGERHSGVMELPGEN